MGSFLSTAAGTNNNYQANNPYNSAASMATAQAQQGQIYGQQQALAGQLQQTATGQGPSASQTMLAQAQQNNNAAALGAATGNRGINQGMALRNAQQGNAAANQQANAQGIAARQQEQQTATGQLAGTLNSMGNNNTAQQGLISGAAANANNTNASIAYGNQQQGSKIVGGLTGGAAGAAMMAAARGGMIQSFDQGGMSMPQIGSQFGPQATQAPQLMQQTNTGGSAGLTQPVLGASFTGQTSAPTLWDTPQPSSGSNKAASAAAFFGGVGDSMNQGNSGFGIPQVGSATKSNSNSGASMASNGKALASMMAYRGGQMSMKSGGKVPGQPITPGNNPKNDTVPAMLSPKEIVIPNSITQGKDAPEAAKRFVAAILAKQGMKK